MSRVAANWDAGPSWSILGLRRDRGWRPTVVARVGRSAAIGVGALRLSGVAPSLRELMGVARSARRPGAPGAGSLEVEPAASLTVSALQGIAATVGRTAAGSYGSGASGWIALGAPAGGGVAGVMAGAAFRSRAARRSASRLAVGAGWRRSARPRSEALALSASVERMGPGAEGGLELLASGRRRAALIGATKRIAPWRLSGRWRYRSWDREPTAGELSASCGGALGGGRTAGSLTWRPWSAAARGDDGRIEIEASAQGYGAGSTRVRLGLAGADPGGTAAGERYGLLETTVAEERWRRLVLFAARRAHGGWVARALGTTLGGRLELERGGSSLEFRVEASRVKGAGGATWGIGLGASGDAILRVRTRSGVTFASRGALGLSAWHLGYVAERTREAGESRSMSARMWIERRMGS